MPSEPRAPFSFETDLELQLAQLMAAIKATNGADALEADLQRELREVLTIVRTAITINPGFHPVLTDVFQVKNELERKCRDYQPNGQPCERPLNVEEVLLDLCQLAARDGVSVREVLRKNLADELAITKQLKTQVRKQHPPRDLEPGGFEKGEDRRF